DLWVFSAAAAGGEDGDFYSLTVADGETLDVNIYFSDAMCDTDLFIYDAADPNCGLGYGNQIPGSTYGYSTSDDEAASWTNTTGAAVAVIIHVDVFTNGTEDCVIYDLEISGGSSALGTPFCFADGSDTGGVSLCVCGNIELDLPSPPGTGLPVPGVGCAHSGGVGAYLTAAGSPT
ncbi:MAG: hypothetical protein GY953_38540, partial [bacterium]|nr:hypothetical protein [bacterium]